MRFQTYLLAAVAAATAYAQSNVVESATSAASSAASSVVSSVTGTSSSASRSASSSASSASSVSSASSAAASSASSGSGSASASASATGTSPFGDENAPEEATSTRVYTTTYYYLKHNPTYGAVSPTLLVESVIVSTSGISDQQTFSTPSDALTVLSLSRSTYTTTWTSDNQYAAQVPTLTGTTTVTTTFGLPDLSTRPLNAGAGQIAARGAGSIGGVAAFFLGVAAMF